MDITIILNIVLLFLIVVNMLGSQFSKTRERASGDYREIVKELSQINTKINLIEFRVDDLSKNVDDLSKNVDDLFKNIEQIKDKQVAMEREIENIKKIIEDESSNRRVELNLSHMEQHRHALCS